MLLILAVPVSPLPMVVLFVLIAIAVFSFFYAFEQKNTGKALTKRLAAVSQAESRGSTEELDLLREQLVSDIPALNRILARYHGTVRLQRFLAQADVKMLPGKFLLICLFTGALTGMVVYLWEGYFWLAVLMGLIGSILPFVYLGSVRRRWFQKSE
jgi:tight adherence protein B